MDATFDPRPLFLRSLDQLEKLAGEITPEQLDRPTPCTEFDLRALIGHTVGAVHRIAYVGEGGRGLDLAAQVGRVEDTDWAGAVGRARARAAAAWAEDGKLDQVVDLPWGRFPGRFAVSAYLMEIATHTWDITRVTDPTAALDEEVGQVALGIAEFALPADQPRGEEVPFGPVQPVPVEADAYTRLAGWLGRTV